MSGVRLCERPVRFTTRPDPLCDGGRIVIRRSGIDIKEREAGEGEERGGMGSRPILVIVAVALVLGIAVYLRLWTMDFSISSDDAELLRSDHANPVPIPCLVLLNDIARFITLM